MEEKGTPVAGAADKMQGMTITTLVLVAIAIVTVLAAIWWGRKLRLQRKRIEAELARSRQTVHPEPGQATETAPPPVAPPPPPLADTPVAAAAPFEAAPAAMATDLATPPPPPAPAVPPPPAGADDFTRMKGVGPKLAARLNELGITSYAQIAALTPEQAADLDAQLGTFKGRLVRDRWIEQAGYLARDDRDGFEAAFGKL
ncbi:hypothetical protein LZK98_19415 [Sphingomonas cannabina]|uniref:hypothetical protein n=1 Tax=Sphingomonas cannabina TaxID=2899123 RepID=UPI001F3444D7|nr:hypothetical protein [Sphingomonas cannabina]UIJ45186.1 hypothetical protein LZK98_19415 [Sphingomonas cannabina]